MTSKNASGAMNSSVLAILDSNTISSLSFETPVKRIHDGPDVSFFLTSLAYRDIMTFILQLNRAMVPRKSLSDGRIQEWPIGSERIVFSESVTSLQKLISKLQMIILEAPPDTGPRRFGNVSFRKWYKMVGERLPTILRELLPPDMLPALPEIEAYLLGSFGSPQRLDYGTGHELSFVAFLGCLWKLGFFPQLEIGVDERGIVVGVFEPYLGLIRELIKLYNLEPAGSHGVWGLDDNSFLPYVFGSAQLSPAITEDEQTPLEGSIANAPEPSSVSKGNLVEKERSTNLYFSAIAFIYEVKKGPFWEHSPILFDVSGIKDGWGKVNKGMIKMYNAEVLSKFPVVQHFPFGSLFKWEKDPEAHQPAATTHTASQPLRNPLDSNAPHATRPAAISHSMPGTAAPWAARPAATPVGMVDGVTRAPWANQQATRPPPAGLNLPRGVVPSQTARPTAPTPRQMQRRSPLPEEGS